MNAFDELLTSLSGNPSFHETRRQVAVALLERADGRSGSPRLTVRGMATNAGVEWETVHLSLRSLQEEGAIRLDRHRIFIRRDLLQKAAGEPVL